ncbi:MAG: Calx-beta domain-containing protein, partial [Acidimicrobiia bacterium]
AWQPVPGDVTIPAGQTTLLVRTTVTDDALDENPETFTLTAVHVSGTLLSSADVTATGTITDDDPAPGLSINDVAVNEAAGSATFTVTLDAPSGLTVTVDYATASGSATSGADFTATSGSLTFAPGETSKTVTVAITNDGTYEGLETFTVDLSNAANATFLDASGSGSITDDGTGPGGSDDDRPSLSIANIAVTEGTDTHAVFSLVLSNPSVEPVVLSLALADGSALIGTDTGSTLEYFDGSAWQPVPGDVTIPAGQTTLLVRTTVTDDALDENPETFTLTAVHVSGTLLSSTDVTATGTITDDDPAPGLSINDVAVNEAAGSATFTVTLDAPSGLTVTVDYATASGSATSGADFTATSGSLTFAPGETSKTVTVAITNDGTYEGLETFTVDLSNAANASFLDASGSGSITDDGTGPGGSDDDRPSLSIANIAVTEGTDTHAVFSLVLSNPSVEPVVLSLALADGSALIGTDTGSTLEYFDGSAWQPVPGDVTIPAGQTTLLVRTTVTDDALDENPETFTLTAVHVSGTLLSSTDVTATGTITDDDPAPGLSINDVAVNEAAGSATFTVTLDAPSGLTVTVDYATASGSATSGADFTAASGSLTFAPGETSKTVTVAITNDGTYELNEMFTVDLSNAANAAFLDASGIGTIIDDDADAVDDPYTTDEDTSITGNVLTNDHNTNGGLSVIEVGGNPSDIGKLVPGDNGGTFLIGTDGSYTFHPGPDFQYLVNGESVVTSVTYTAVNLDGNTDRATLSITVTGVNDRPIIDLNSQVELQYTDETAFLAASGVTSVESFETATGTLDGFSNGDFSITVTGAVDTGFAASAFGATAPDGAQMGTITAPDLGTYTLDLDFATPVDSVGFTLLDIHDPGNDDANSTINIYLDGALVWSSQPTEAWDAPSAINFLNGDTVITGNGTVTFFGFSSPTAFSQVRIEVSNDDVTAWPSADNIGIDRVVYGMSTNAYEFATIFTEGDVPVPIADSDADLDDIGELDVTSLTIATGALADGSAEILTIAGHSFALDTDGSAGGLTVGGSQVDIDFVGGVFTITNALGSSIPLAQGDLDILIRGITYENTSEAPTAGDRTFDFTANDEGGLTGNTARSTVTVIPVNDPPVAEDDAITTNEDSPVTGSVLVNNGNGPDSDV